MVTHPCDKILNTWLRCCMQIWGIPSAVSIAFSGYAPWALSKQLRVYTPYHACCHVLLLHNISHAKGKASTAKQTCLGSLLGLEMTTYWKDISSPGHLPCQLDLRKIRSPAITAFTVRYCTVNLRIYSFAEKYYTMFTEKCIIPIQTFQTPSRYLLVTQVHAYTSPHRDQLRCNVLRLVWKFLNLFPRPKSLSGMQLETSDWHIYYIALQSCTTTFQRMVVSFIDMDEHT